MLRTFGQLTGMLALSIAVYGEPIDRGQFVQTKSEAPTADRNGDPLPAGALVRMGSVRWRHGDNVSFVAFTADGKGVVTASQDNTIRLWDRETGREVRRFEAKVEPGKLIAPPRRVGDPFGQSSSARVTLSKDGKMLATLLSNNTTVLWEVDTGKEIRRFNGPPGGAVAILLSPDGKTLAARTFDRTIHLIDTETGNEIRSIKNKGVNGPMRVIVVGGQIDDSGAGFAFSADGKSIATSESDGNMNKVTNFVRLSETGTGNLIRQIDTTTNGASSIAYSPDGKLVTFATGGIIQIYKTNGDKQITMINTGVGTTCLAFSPDNKTIAAKSRDQVVRVYDAKTGDKLHEFGNPAVAAAGPNFGVNAFIIAGGATGDARDMAFSSDGKVLAVGIGQTLRFWNVSTGKEQPHASSGHRGAVSAVAFSADGKTMYSRGADDMVRRWDSFTGQELGQFMLPKGSTTVQFSTDGTKVAVANMDGTIRLFSVSEGKQLLQMKGHANGAAGLAFSPDGKMLASRGGADNAIRLLDVATGDAKRQILLLNANPAAGGGAVVIRGGLNVGVEPIAFSPDGLHLAVSMTGSSVIRGQPQLTDGSLRIFDINTGKEIRHITVPVGQTFRNLVYSPDGRVVAAENANQTVSLWEIAGGRERGAVGEPGGAVVAQPGGAQVFFAGIANVRPGLVPTALAYSPDGGLIASRGPNNSIHVWEVAGANKIGEFKGHDGAVVAAAFTADGKRLASTSNDTTILVWDVASLKRTPTRVAQLQPKEIESMWADLAGDNAVRAVACVNELASDAKTVVPFLAERVKPAAPVDVNKLDQWLADLDSSNFQKRSKATAELERLGDLAIPALRKLSGSEITVETRRRVEALLEKVTTGVLTTDQLRMVRAIESLEKMATPESRKLLQTLADGAPGALQTRHAQAALARLAKRS